MATRYQIISNYASLIVFTSVIFFTGCVSRQDDMFYQTIGCYTIDLSRTDLGDYSKDFLQYEHLKVEFFLDSTFKFNMSVPFFLDTTGVWIPSKGGPEDMSWFMYSCWKKLPEINTGNQFTPVYGQDSIIMFNGVAPKNNQSLIQKIYFKKYNCNE